MTTPQQIASELARNPEWAAIPMIAELAGERKRELENGKQNAA
jgi:hypothetical protein